MRLKLDLHDIYHRGSDIDRAYARSGTSRRQQVRQIEGDDAVDVALEAGRDLVGTR